MEMSVIGLYQFIEVECEILLVQLEHSKLTDAKRLIADGEE